MSKSDDGCGDAKAIWLEGGFKIEFGLVAGVEDLLPFLIPGAFKVEVDLPIRF